MNSFDLDDDDWSHYDEQVLLVTGGFDGNYNELSSTEVSLSSGKSFGFGEIDKQNDFPLSVQMSMLLVFDKIVNL